MKKNKLINKKIFIFKKIPTKQKYLLTISATTSRERLSSIKEFFKNNDTKYMLLEKFCFFSVSQFDEFKKKFNSKTKTFVNSWGYMIAKKSGVASKLKKFTVVCKVKEGNLLSNITHLFHFFYYLNKKNPIKNFNHRNTKILKNFKRSSYDELRSTIHLEDKKKNIFKIETKKKMNDLITFYILQKTPRLKLKISIKNDNFIYFYNSGIEKKKIKFPFSSKTTFIFLKHLMNKNFNIMPSFLDDSEFSKKILRELNVKIP